MQYFSTKDAAKILDTTEDQIRTYARLGEIVPLRGPNGRLEFEFQHLLLLKTTKGLLEAGVPARRLRRIWSSLRRQLASGLPLTSIEIFADGNRAVAWDGSARWQPDSGQFLLNFEAGEVAERAEEEAARADASREREDPEPATSEPARNAIPSAAAAPEASEIASAPKPVELAVRRKAAAEDDRRAAAAKWFRLGCELESTSPVEARHAYLQAVELDRDLADAHLNLGRLEHEAGHLAEAEAHYREVVRCTPSDSMCHFNLGVLLEDRGRASDAALAYEQAIACDPNSADAHYNLGLLLETLGRRNDAMRHLINARRLYAEADGAR